MKQNKIKSKRKLERGCNFHHAMLSSKYPSLTSNTNYYNYLGLF